MVYLLLHMKQNRRRCIIPLKLNLTLQTGNLNSSGVDGSEFGNEVDSAYNCTRQLDSDSQFLHNTTIFYVPELNTLYASVRWGFLLHAYGFACLFFFLAFYAFFSILNLRSQLSTRPYMSTINSFLCLLGASRAAGLFIDPYGLKKTMPVLMGSLIWDLGFPCLISSFSLIQIAFLQLTQQLDLGPEKFRKKTCLSVVITVHFVTVIAAAIYSNFNTDLMMVKLVTQLAFALWGLLLCGSFLYAGKRVLGVLGSSGGSTEGSSLTSATNDKGIANLFGMGLLAPGQNLASSLTAALAPTLLQGSGSSSMNPKIKITDENDRTVSVASDSSRLNETNETGTTTTNSSYGGFNPQSQNASGRPSAPIPGPSSSKSSMNNPPSATTSNANNGSPVNDTPPANTGSGPGGSNYVRPPSPVLPRRKSSGPGMRGGPSSIGSRRLSLNRRDSGVNVPPDSLPTGGSDKECRKKSLTWCEIEKDGKSIIELDGSSRDKRKSSRKSIENNTYNTNANDINSDRNGGAGTESLLSSGGPDYTLQSILSHIAYVNQTALDYRLSRKLSRKNQVHKVIKYTSITAILGVLLCIGELIRILSPYGIFVSTSSPSPWPWFALQTVCRTIEFAMGATVANITKQPVNRPHHYAYSIRHKHHHHRESLYL